MGAALIERIQVVETTELVDLMIKIEWEVLVVMLERMALTDGHEGEELDLESELRLQA